MSWLNADIKIPRHWYHPENEQPWPNVIELIGNYLNEGDTDISDTDGTDYVIVSFSGHARHGLYSIGTELDELCELRVPWRVADDGDGDEIAPPSWHLYDGREVGDGTEHLLFGHSDNMISRGECVSILAGNHAWAVTILGYFDDQPTLEAASIEHLANAPHPDDDDDVDDELAVM